MVKSKEKQRGKVRKQRAKFVVIGAEGKNKTERNYFHDFFKTNKEYKVKFSSSGDTDPEGIVNDTIKYIQKEEINLDNILKDNPMNSDLINRIKKIEGVTDVRYRDVLVSRMGKQLDSVEVLDREDFGRMYDEGASIGEFTYDSATENSQILFGWSSFLADMGFSPGDTVEGNLENGNTSVDFSMEIGGSFGHSNGGWVITEDTFKNMGFTPGSCIGTIWVDCSEEDISEVEKELNTILADENHIDIESFSDSLKEQEFGGLIIKYAIYALLAVISIISFANLANTMIISITTRRREYGIMQAVGMTGKQLCRSLSFQGLIYTGGTLAVSLAAGIPLGFLAFRWCKQHAPVSYTHLTLPTKA